MQIREITVTYGGKLNLGDYNSAHVEISITGVLNDGEDARAATAVLFDQAKAAVRDQAAELQKKVRTAASQAFAGLPVDVREILEG
jgi:hypothetical protein